MSGLALQRMICSAIFIGQMIADTIEKDHIFSLGCMLAAFLFAYLAARAQSDFNRANRE